MSTKLRVDCQFNKVQALCDEMDRTKQIAFEAMPQFARRSRVIAEAAYPKNDRTDNDLIVLLASDSRLICWREN